MHTFIDKTVGEIVRQNIKTADVFHKRGIDFCCGGNISILKACQKNGIEFSEIEQELEAVFHTISPSINFDKWELDYLIDYILNNHHQYILQESPVLLAYTEKVANAHGENHSEVVEIHQLVVDLVNELLPHLHKEERILFPYVKQLVEAQRKGEKVTIPGFGFVKSPISVMEAEHEKAGEIIKKIAELSHQFQTPADACQTYKAAYAKLEEYQNDLFQHIHLENNILFPKAINLEEKLHL
jgi:regulator of cell morphogenesis and NO signaling